MNLILTNPERCAKCNRIVFYRGQDDWCKGCLAASLPPVSKKAFLTVREMHVGTLALVAEDLGMSVASAGVLLDDLSRMGLIEVNGIFVKEKR